jgi:hypothetical protein
MIFQKRNLIFPNPRLSLSLGTPSGVFSPEISQITRLDHPIYHFGLKIEPARLGFLAQFWRPVPRKPVISANPPLLPKPQLTSQP